MTVSREDEEILIAGRAEGGAVAVGMLVHDVVADADVDGDRHAEPHAGGQDADVLVRKRPVEDGPAQRFAEPEARVGARRESTSFMRPGLAPQAELAGAGCSGRRFRWWRRSGRTPSRGSARRRSWPDVRRSGRAPSGR